MRAPVPAFTLVLALLVPPSGAAAQTLLGDFGDAPEGFPAYPDGAIGHFPTCLTAGSPGTREIGCESEVSTTPGPTGFVKHLPSLRGTSYWLGCHPGPAGLDLESDGKSSSSGNPGCGIAADCTGSDSYPLWPPMTFGQDECAGDGVDAGLAFGEFVSNCGYLTRVQFGTYNAGASTQVYLNLLLDMNFDGDWNDSFGECGCLHEWAVKNAPITVPSGCASHDSPPFQIKTWFGAPAWLRITLTDDIVDDDFPWKGSAGLTDDAVHGGETEDYLAAILAGDPVIPASWGEVKVRYR